MLSAKGYAALDARSLLAPFKFNRRDPDVTKIVIEIMYCGVCHSDLHSIRNEWKNAVHPMGPGHEIVGRIVAVGSTVAGFKPSVTAAIEVIVDSCCQCAKCRSGE